MRKHLSLRIITRPRKLIELLVLQFFEHKLYNLSWNLIPLHLTWKKGVAELSL